VGASLVSVDGIGERENVLIVPVIVLQGDFRDDSILLSLQVDGLRMKAGLVLAQVRDEGDDSPLVVEGVLFLVPLIVDGDFDALVQEGEFA